MDKIVIFEYRDLLLTPQPMMKCVIQVLSS